MARAPARSGAHGFRSCWSITGLAQVTFLVLPAKRGADARSFDPGRAAGLKLATLAEEPRVWVLPSGHPLAGRDCLLLSDTEALPWVAAAAATDGCHPTAWRDDWLLSPRPSGAPPVIGATARTIDEWREYVAAGRGVSLCPASAETFHARPGITFVPGKGVPVTPLCLA